MTESSISRNRKDSDKKKSQKLKYRGDPAVLFEDERNFVEEALSDFVQVPTKKSVAGLWQKKIRPEVLNAMDPKEIKRQETIHEVIESESFYLRDLSITYRKFMIPLQSILTFDEYNEIFCNFSEVIAFHASLGSKMRKLRTVTGQVNAIGATMLEEIEDLEMSYSVYCSNRAKSRDYLNQKRKDSIKIHKFIRQAELEPECRKLELDTFLSQPWQRLMHYPLLFQNILKRTPEDHEDQANLTQVIARLNTIIGIVNNYTQKIEFTRILEDLHSSLSKPKAEEFDLISPERKIMYEGAIKTRRGRRLYGYLIDNCLVITVIGDKLSLYCDPINLQFLGLKTMVDQVNITTNMKGEKPAANVQRNIFYVINRQTGMKLMLSTESAPEKRKWVDAIQTELLKLTSNWRDTYDQDYQLHDPTDKDERKIDSEATSIRSFRNGSIASDTSDSGDSRRESTSQDFILKLLGDPYGLLSYTKTMASCTSAMVHQLNAKALMSEDSDRKENLWTTAKVISDSTIELIRAAKILATKPADKSASTQSYLEAFKALHATLNLNVDDLEDVVGIGANKIEGVINREEGEDGEYLPGTDPEAELKKLISLEGNKLCADCNSPNPQFVCIEFEVFICNQCGEAHKTLGEQFNSFQTLKSIENDQFSIAEIDKISQSGNPKVNSILQAYIPPENVQPNQDSSIEERINWIKLKYYEKAFIIEKAPIIPPSEVKEPERKESSSSLRKPIGHITIKQILIELNEKSMSGYCTLEVGVVLSKTKSAKKSKELLWEDLEISFSMEDFTDTLSISLFEKRVLKDDELLGKAELLLDFLGATERSGNITKYTMKFLDSEGKHIGDMTIGMLFG